ncbi:Na+/H+ antiporter [Angustibacter sp. McL0619]|uniref:Na+/H+ antiporter n=1 Tax=Angustibacter sp. McL0619 TaxID=3415676 RepID=UPI003CE9B881
MHAAFGFVEITVVVTLVAGLAQRYGASPPLVLVAAGVLCGYLPFVPEVRLNPEVVLVGVLPPLLYAAAIRSSLVDFRANRSSILLLSVGYTLFTTVVVALVAFWVIPPPFSVAAAFALGAVVAPPDAVAASAIARRVGMPRRVVSILEGESLVNDATALVALNTARTAIISTIAVWEVGLDFAWASVGGVLAGVAVAWVFSFVRRRVNDPVIDTVLSLLAPFVAYLVGERVHASGVLAVVVTGLLLSHRSHLLQSGASRLAEASNWRTIQFLLENAVFLMIGLQAPFVVDQARQELSDPTLVMVCASVLLVVLLSRFVWVYGAYLVRLLLHRQIDDGWTWRTSTLVAWAGMRGVVTLAAVLALPEQTPHRGTLLLVAFVVVVGTLSLQGLTLPALARALKLPGPDPAEDALAQAALLSELTKAGIERLDRERTSDDPDDVVESLRGKSEQRVASAWERLGRPHDEYEPPSATYLRLRLAMLDSERAALIKARDEGRYDDEVLRAGTTVLDVEESLLDRRELSNERLAERLAPERTAQGCEHLLAAPTLVKPGTPDGCEECLRDGTTWVHLRLCLTCGHVGCCDSSPEKHAGRHFDETDHPVMRSFEPHEHWRWCFVDELLG